MPVANVCGPDVLCANNLYVGNDIVGMDISFDGVATSIVDLVFNGNSNITKLTVTIAGTTVTVWEK